MRIRCNWESTFLTHLLFIFTLFFFLTLNGCTTLRKTSHPDGPPCFYVDESKIPNAIPRKEKFSKYGNMHVYCVKGRYYQVLRSAYHYRARGIASWYGTKFHRRKTSSGERYNMLAMTAAHKTLPLPTYVRVTNLRNGKKVIVKVNDRGPFRDNRLIDLSYVAAKKLGMAARGTAYVEVESISFERPCTRFYRYPCFKTYPHYVQVGAFRHKQNALRLQKKLVSLIHSPVQINRTQHVFKIKIGPIKDVATRTQITNTLRSIGLHPEN